ncbi:hypothetical protein J6590_097124, partial [Homalodisca vitripennis]
TENGWFEDRSINPRDRQCHLYLFRRHVVLITLLAYRVRSYLAPMSEQHEQPALTSHRADEIVHQKSQVDRNIRKRVSNVCDLVPERKLGIKFF